MKRRDFMKTAGLAGAGLVLLPGFSRRGLYAVPAAAGLSDPALQPKFAYPVPDAMAPGFKVLTPNSNDTFLKIYAEQTIQQTGLLSDPDDPTSLLDTPVWGYGKKNWNGGTPTWPGPTIEAKSKRKVQIRWENRLNSHLLPVDTSLHWCYSLHGYTQYNIANDGVPIVSHLHGGHTDFPSDGNPEFFFSPGYAVRGPQFRDKTYKYDNDQPAGNLWYHDHALGITRLNVYAGLAGFYFVRDRIDTGDSKNKLGLPAWPYEKAYAIQDRMFSDNGDLFYSAYPGDPFYDDFITGEGVTWPANEPTALAEFFGDHMLVNGWIWPYEAVEPRQYRLHLLNGTDSRFMVIRFRQAESSSSTSLNDAGPPLPFKVIGSDQGLASEAKTTDTLVFEPGSRYDIIFDFSTVDMDSRIIMENIAGDAPFGGDYGDALTDDDFFTNRQTDRVMAFDVTQPLAGTPMIFDYGKIDQFKGVSTAVDRYRKVALFEGKDEFGRLQPLLGTAEPATDYLGNPINWPNTTEYSSVGLVGQMDGSIAWHSPTTENPAIDTTEEWEVWNATGDAHPVHLHLVHFEVIGRKEIVWDSATNDEDRVLDPTGVTAPAPNDDGTYLVTQPTVQHNSITNHPDTYGMGFKLQNLTTGNDDVILDENDGYVENAPKDMVTALPDQVTIIRAHFDKPGRYVWHCHILSHEDHEMMRVLHVGAGSFAKPIASAAETAVPLTFNLAQNYPNPFNPSTTINFQIPKDELVELKIFTMLGREVKTLVNNRYEAGSHSVSWDGKNKNGRNVASGTYIYRIKAGKYYKSMKMNLVR